MINGINTKRLLAGVMAITLGMTFAPLAPAHAGVPAVCGPIDLALVVDDTGSMGGAIGSIQSELPNIIQDAKDVSGNDVRYALWTFKDAVQRDTGDNFVNEATVTAAINALGASGGNGLPEASDIAKRDVVNVLNWANDRLKIAVLITDAAPGGDGSDSPVDIVDLVDVQRMIDAAVAAGAKPGAGIFMSDIYVPTFGADVALGLDHPSLNPDTLVQLLMADASLSGGTFMTVAANGAGTGEALSTIIQNCGGEQVIGGEILSVDSAALLVGGLTSVSIWMAPVLAGAAGVAAFYIKTRKN